MGFNKLIANQNIRIDNHISGGEIRASDRSLHIHKEMNNGNYGGIEIKIPLYGEEEIQFKNFTGGKNLERRLKKEIIEALTDKVKVRALIIDVCSWIKANGNFNRMNQDEIIACAKSAIITLRKHFDSYPKVSHQFEVIVDGVIGHFWPTDGNDIDKELYIKADTKNSVFSVARDQHYI